MLNPAAPLVSVVLPTFNRACTIRRAITSVLTQEGVELELIVVDDCSTDETMDVIADFAADPRVRILSSGSRAGGSGARNIGIAAARAEYIAFQDSDDEWLAGKLAAQMAALLAGGERVALSYCAYLRVAGGNAEYLPRRLADGKRPGLDRLLIENFISTQTIVVRRAALEAVGGFDTSLPRYQDWDLVIRLSGRFEFQFVDQPLVVVYDTPGNLTSISRNEIPAREIILAKLAEDGRGTPSLLALHDYVLSRIAFQAGRFGEARRYAQRSFARHRTARGLARVGLSGIMALARGAEPRS